MYKLTSYNSVIKKISATELLFIPMNKDNSDYQEYLKWLAEGNTPMPADEGTQ